MRRRGTGSAAGTLRRVAAAIALWVAAAIPGGTAPAYAQSDTAGDAGHLDAPGATSCGAYGCSLTPASQACERSFGDGFQFPEANRLRPGSELVLPLDDDALTDARVCFSLRNGPPGCGLPGTVSFKTVEGRRQLHVRVPQFDRLNTLQHAATYVEPCMEISSRTHGPNVARWRIEVVSPRAAWMGALTFVLLVLAVARGLTGKKVLELVTSHSKRYSLSLAQFFLWTLVAVFGVVYVWLLTESVLDLTTEVLALMGISVVTAVGGKIQAVSRIARLPEAAKKYMKQAAESKTPKLGDLIEIDGRPSLARLQMLVFTVITVVIVLWWLLEHYVFPPLDRELVLLMGLSGAAYLANQATPSVSEESVDKKLEEVAAKEHAVEELEKLNGDEALEALKRDEAFEKIAERRRTLAEAQAALQKAEEELGETLERFMA